jgi:cytochrome c-type biogenesis protein CcmH
VRNLLRRLLQGGCGLLPLLVATLALADQAPPLAADPALEERLVAIAHDLRCLVCQNETIAASNADLAVDLRQQIREQLRAGRSDDEIRAYMVARYGDFVLYKPPWKAKTLLLWLGPFALLLAGSWLMWRQLRQRRAPPPLTEADRERARALLRGDPP